MHAKQQCTFCKANAYFCKDTVFDMNGKTRSEYIKILPNVGEQAA